MTLQSRLKRCMRDGNLTVADLARWFDRPYPTVRSWIFNGVVFGGGPLDRTDTEKRLAKLEKLIKQGVWFPVPRMSPRDKITYFEKFE